MSIQKIDQVDAQLKKAMDLRDAAAPLRITNVTLTAEWITADQTVRELSKQKSDLIMTHIMNGGDAARDELGAWELSPARLARWEDRRRK